MFLTYYSKPLVDELHRFGAYSYPRGTSIWLDANYTNVGPLLDFYPSTLEINVDIWAMCISFVDKKFINVTLENRTNLIFYFEGDGWIEELIKRNYAFYID